MFSKKLLIPLLSLSLLVTPAYSSHAAENAEAAGTSVEGQGMLSPSSSSESSESVFNGSGAGTSSEPVTDEKLETILKQVQSNSKSKIFKMQIERIEIPVFYTVQCQNNKCKNHLHKFPNKMISEDSVNGAILKWNQQN